VILSIFRCGRPTTVFFFQAVCMYRRLLRSARPLILFMHGAGETGTDNVDQINRNIDNLLAEAKVRGAFLLAPQTNTTWADTTITSRTATMIDRALAAQHVDVNRIYVTGLSLGGGGVWNMLNRYPTRFAASVPIVGVAADGQIGSDDLRCDLGVVWRHESRIPLIKVSADDRC
jgi:predicted peptidase